jgi:hypothetical protein
MALHPCCRFALLCRDERERTRCEHLLPFADLVLDAASLAGSQERAFVALLRKAGVPQNLEHSDRLEREARAGADPDASDIILLGSIRWRYRFQRPQQLALALARLGRRVVYVEPETLPGGTPSPYLIEESPAPNVFVVRLRAQGAVDLHARPASEGQRRDLRAHLAALGQALALGDRTVLLVQAPFWHPLASALPRSLLAYDCMDLYAGFANVQPPLVALEQELLREADLVVVSSQPLAERVSGARRLAVVRNGCDFERFASAQPHGGAGRPRFGYVGAVDRWFDAALLERCAAAHPDWDFVIAGSTAGLPAGSLRPRPNLLLLGEVDYQAVPGLVAGFDVCLIPFLDLELTRCVNPVKVYEYLAAGKPVVASELPELRALEPGLVHLARTHDEFLAAIETALLEAADPLLARRRREWARGHDWSARARELLLALGAG